VQPSRQEDQEQLLTPKAQYYMQFFFAYFVCHSTGKDFEKDDVG